MVNRKKTKRAYDARGRREMAQRTRAGILDVAERLFMRDGYHATTVAAIAAAAAVSVDTVYKSFGGKPGLVRAIYKRGLEGVGPVRAERRSDELQARERDPRAIIAGWGAFTSEITPRVAPIALLARAAAATDDGMKEMLDDLSAQRLRRMTQNAKRLDDAGHLRAGVSVQRAADLMWTYTAPELYELLVLKRGWTAVEYGRFVAEAITAALL